MAFPDVLAGAEPPVEKYLVMGDQTTGYWFDSLGWVAYFFAQIEWASFVVLEKLETPSKLAQSSALLFKKRSRRAAELLASKLSDIQLAAEWAEFWSDAVEAADMRNKVLHNPLTFGVDGREVSSEHDGIKLMQEPGQPVIKLGRVQAYHKALHALAMRMHDLFKRTTLP